MKFTYKTVNRVAMYQNYGVQDAKVHEEMLDAKWPAYAKKLSGPVYALFSCDPNEDAQGLIREGKANPERFTKFTESKETALQNVKEFWFEDFHSQGNSVYLVKIDNPEKFLNIANLHTDPDFKTFVSNCRSEGKWFDEGLEFGGMLGDVAVSVKDMCAAEIVQVVDVE